MPSYKGHLIGGALFFFAAKGLVPAHYLVGQDQVLLCGITLAGALFPDVDIKSKGQKFFYILGFVLGIILLHKKLWNLFVLLVFMLGVPLLVKHRGIMHHPYTIIIAPWLFSYILQQLIHQPNNLWLMQNIFFSVGALSHIILDFGPKKFLEKFLK